MSQSTVLGTSPRAAGLRDWTDALACVPLWAWALAAAAVMAALGITSDIAKLRLDYGDTDDAMRMVQVRDFIASGRWFDTTIPRLGGPDGMLSHWSRLIDLPLALLIKLFALVMPVASAEFAVRLAWPFLLLAPMLAVMAHAVERMAGRLAALICIALLMASPSALIQFTAGRIDHHNVMNLGACGAVLLLWAARCAPLMGAWAGLLAALAIAIGYEALPLVVVTTAAASMWGLLDRKATAGARAFVLALAAGTAGFFLLTTAPSRWTDVRCDALSLNVVLLLAAGACGVSLALGPARRLGTIVRWAIAGVGACVGTALFAVSEPACLAGPMGQLPEALKSVWLVNVAETKSWLSFLEMSVPGALSIVLLCGLGIAAQLKLVRDTRAPQHLFYLTVLLAAVPLAFWQLKYMPYASILAIPPMAVAIAAVRGLANVSAITVRAGAFLAVNQWTLIILSAIGGPLLLGTPADAAPAKDAAKACHRNDHIAEIARLPQGLVLAPVDLGSHLLADTPHNVLAAPYHRIATAILDTHAVLASRDVSEAESLLRHAGARHVVICPAMPRLVTPVPDAADTFHARLKRNDTFAFLERVPAAAGSPYMIWRVKPAQP